VDTWFVELIVIFGSKNAISVPKTSQIRNAAYLQDFHPVIQ
jgi:hypothetical protein